MAEAEITREKVDAEGRMHAGYWMRALWIIELLKPGYRLRTASPPNHGPPPLPPPTPVYPAIKLAAYLSYVLNPPREDAEVVDWRLAERAKVGHSLAAWASKWIPIDPNYPLTAIQATERFLMQQFGSRKAVHAHLLAVASEMATKRDRSFHDADIRFDVRTYLAFANLTPIMQARILHNPLLEPACFTPAQDPRKRYRRPRA